MRRKREEVKNFGRRVHVISATVYGLWSTYGRRSAVYRLFAGSRLKPDATITVYRPRSTVLRWHRLKPDATAQVETWCYGTAEARCYDYCLPSTVYGFEMAQAKARCYGTG